MALFLIPNGPMPTTAALAKVTTGTAIKTLQQLITKAATLNFKIVEWGISFDGSVAAAPLQVELIETGAVGATFGGAGGAAYAQADLVPLDALALAGALNPVTNIIDCSSTSKSGYAGSGANTEGSITASRLLDGQLIAPTNQYVKQFPLGREPIIQCANFVRVRVTAGAAVNAWSYLVIEI